MEGNDYGSYVERTPLSSRLSVEAGTKKSPTAFERPRNKGITSGLANDKNLKHQPIVKRKRAGAKDVSSGYSPDSHEDMNWQEGDDVYGIDGMERHMYDMLMNDSEESNIF